jgi:SepF-like predicted cell division protein (DUF552 family)
LGFFDKLFGKKDESIIDDGIKKVSYEIEEISPQGSEDELLVVITAAVKAYTEASEKLVVRSYKRVETQVPAWNRVARESLLRG